MPSLTFALPHWLYWSALVAFPLAAMYLVRRQRREPAPSRFTLPLGYFLLITCGFVGLHRFYFKSLLGLVYIPLFLAILYGNIQGRDARDALSNARNEIASAEFLVERARKRVDGGRDGAADGLRAAERALSAARAQLDSASRSFDGWDDFSGSFALAILVLLVLDAVRLPRLARRAEEKTARTEEGTRLGPVAAARARPDRGVDSRFSHAVDAVNGFVGRFVAYWSVLAVFAYYYEVLARYVFNSPTNWAHESMFLMFGMQYLLAGGYALREGSHVRVDVLYLHFSDRGKVLVDVFTSLFFFIFAGTLAWTGWVFFRDAMMVREVSFTEWAVQYYPVKAALPLGAALLFLQGLSGLVKDLLVLAGRGR